MSEPGAQTFVADQVVYDSTSSDGNVTIHAGIVSQGAGTLDISAARIPGGDRVYQVDIPLSVTTVNAALAPFLLSYDSETQAVTVASAATSQDKERLRNNLLDSRIYDRNARAALAAAVLKAITEQIASDIPDEFRSAGEALRRLGLTQESIDALLTINPANAGAYNTHLLFNVADNLVSTVWDSAADATNTYSTYGTQLLRNIVLSICERKPSRLVASGDNSKVVLRAGDEIVVYVTYTGEIRVSPAVELERFGRSQTELESRSVDGRVLDLDELAWVKLVLRAVV